MRETELVTNVNAFEVQKYQVKIIDNVNTEADTILCRTSTRNFIIKFVKMQKPDRSNYE